MKALVYYVGFYSGATILLKLAGFAVFLWLAQTLSVDDYANFGLLYALQQGLAIFGLTGIAEAIIGLLKEYKLPVQRTHLLAAANIAFLLMAFGAVVFALFVWVMFFKESNIALLTYTSILCSGVLLAFSSFQAQIVRLEEKHFWSLLFSFFPPLTGFVGGFFAFVFVKTVPSFFVGSAAGTLISLLGLWIRRIGLWCCVIRVDETRHILWGAFPFIALAFLGWLNGYGNNYIIDFFFARTDVAKFTFALSLCSIMLLIAGAFNQVWSPRFYRLIHELPFEQVERKNGHFYRVLGLLLGFVSGIVIIIFPSAMGILGGNLLSYQFMSLEISLLYATYVVLTPSWHCYNHFLSNAMGQSVLIITLVTNLVGIGILLVSMWLFGPIGIYIGFLVQGLVRMLGIFLVARKSWPVQVYWSGIAFGLLLIIAGFVLSTSGIALATTMLIYLIIFGVVVSFFFRSELKWLVVK